MMYLLKGKKYTAVGNNKQTKIKQTNYLLSFAVVPWRSAGCVNSSPAGSNNRLSLRADVGGCREGSLPLSSAWHSKQWLFPLVYFKWEIQGGGIWLICVDLGYWLYLKTDSKGYSWYSLVLWLHTPIFWFCRYRPPGSRIPVGHFCLFWPIFGKIFFFTGNKI